MPKIDNAELKQEKSYATQLEKIVVKKCCNSTKVLNNILNNQLKQVRRHEIDYTKIFNKLEHLHSRNNWNL